MSSVRSSGALSGQAAGPTSAAPTGPPLDTAALEAAAVRAAAEEQAGDATARVEALAAAASVVVGAMMLIWPGATLVVGAVLVGAWLVTHGVVRVAQAAAGTAAQPGNRVLAGVVGVLLLGLGALCLRRLDLPLALVATMVGLAWLITGVVELAAAAADRTASAGQRTAAAVLGALGVAGGLAVLAWPGLTLLAFVYLTGVWLVLLGVAHAAAIAAGHRAATRPPAMPART